VLWWLVLLVATRLLNTVLVCVVIVQCFATIFWNGACRLGWRAHSSCIQKFSASFMRKFRTVRGVHCAKFFHSVAENFSFSCWNVTRGDIISMHTCALIWYERMRTSDAYTHTIILARWWRHVHAGRNYALLRNAGGRKIFPAVLLIHTCSVCKYACRILVCRMTRTKNLIYISECDFIGWRHIQLMCLAAPIQSV
jgi:hypothetical protein